MNLSTQKPLSASNIPVTQENFPSLQHFWPCTESADDTALTDIVGGVVTGAASITAEDGKKINVAQASAGVAIAEGTLASPGANKTAILFAVGNLGTDKILNIGLPSGQSGTGSLQMLAVQSKHQSGDADPTTAETATATFADAVEAHAAVLVPDASLTGYRIQADDTYGVNGTPDTTDLVTITNMHQTTAFGNSAATGPIQDLHGIAMFFFDSLPDDLETAMQWMFNEWKAGNKSIYPGWKGKV